MNLYELKGHMWYATERKDEKRNDGIYSIVVKTTCARCGIEEEREDSYAR